MARLFGTGKDGEAPRIERKSVENFFKVRAEKADGLGHVQTVIYQDKNRELAMARDRAEKERLAPILALTKSDSVLDVGCGTGRWADLVIPQCASYLGTDFSPDLIAICKQRFDSLPAAEFICMPAEEISAKNLNRTFDVILSLGLFIYLNDDELAEVLRGYASVAKSKCRILIREPVAMIDRLTILEHYSDDMEQIYNAIYRTETELLAFLNNGLIRDGFRLKSIGDVYEPDLNNRKDTKQRWFLLER